MEIIFLGTASSKATPVYHCDCKACELGRKGGKDNRTRASIAILSEGTITVVDAGPDLPQQMIREDIRDLHNVFLTHYHSDHVAGCWDIHGNTKLRLYAHPKTFEKLDSGLCHFLKGRNPDFACEPFKKMQIGAMQVDSVLLNHDKDDGNWKESEHSQGYVFEETGFKFAYLTDFLEILEKDKVNDCDLLVVDSTFMEKGNGHIGINEGIKLYDELNPKRMLFTHMAHFLPSHKELEEYVSQHGNIGIAYDGLRISSQK